MRATAAIIVAAGSGERLAGEVPKQLRTLAGHAMVLWSVERMRAAELNPVVVVVPPGREAEARSVLRGADAIVTGGETRQESVWNGLNALPEETTHVLVHDAARPCVSPGLLASVRSALEVHDAVVPSVAVVDTLVREAEGRIDAILDRVKIAGVQTPQGFAKSLLRRAHSEARKREFTSSDDGSLVLAIGENVFTVPGERTNIKVTFPEDLILAEAILRNEVV